MKRYNFQKKSSESEFLVVEESNGYWVKYDDVVDEFGEKCDCCGKLGNDRRTLWMGCGYNMDELNIPFKEKKDARVTGFNRDALYTLRVCKQCRSQWMHAIKEWFKRDCQ